ncbi:MAG: membrane protein insertase YidC [Acidobacteriota bacterium]
MEKRTILAIALSALVLIGFQWYQQHYLKPAEEKQGSAAAVQYRQPQEQAPNAQTAPLAEAEPQPPVPAASAADTKAAAQTVVVRGDLYRAVIDNKGGVLTSWELNSYKSAQGRTFEVIASSHDSGTRSFPSMLIFPDSAANAIANDSFYQVSIEGESGTALSPPVTVVLTLKRGDLEIEKRYRFEKDNYLVDLSTTVERGGKAAECRFLLGQDLGPEQEHFLGSIKLEAVYSSPGRGGGKTRRESPPKDENEVKRIGTEVGWVGLDMQYFAMIAIPSQPLPYFDIQKRPVKSIGLDGKEVERDLLRLTTPVSGSLHYQMYLGPKKQSNLEAVKSADITGVINFGTFSILVFPLLSSLRWIHQYVHNYGFAIVILTLLLSLLLFPFRLKQMLSMKKMQVVQPKVKAIQEKYRRYKKTDPKRTEMNQEIMALYKEHNVNPLGGCIPLILQFPLLFAFYALLQYSIELRQAPFIGWIHDLSAKDPYYILPLVMGITMFVSQKMTPMAPGSDPTQAKMMMVMPVVFTLMFFNYSSGLNLYFLCSNIFQIGFQKITERWMSERGSGDDSKSKRA